MAAYIVRRLLWMIPVLLVVTMITFALMHAAPGGPFDSSGPGGRRLPEVIVRNLERQYGLNDPVPVQYVRWVGNMLVGDFGPSYSYRNRTVNDILFQGLPASVQLGSMAFLLSVVVGVPLGVIAALRQNKLPDYVATTISVIGVATPSFIISVFLQLIFAVNLGWFPTGGWRGPEYWVLPTIALSGFAIASIARYTRASMLEVTRRDYVRTAQSKGLRERTIVVIHMIRNALIPVITILGPIFAFLVTGSLIIETIFTIPGIGAFYITSIGTRDYGLIMALTVLFAVTIAVMNLIVDIAYAFIDPRIRYS
ncbi:MAG TPA: ABC transporter permease [Candidatus Limnocylindria bacterium]|nr:ABC transporter permease [Candidatus Limnocylindria bacterium]